MITVIDVISQYDKYKSRRYHKEMVRGRGEGRMKKKKGKREKKKPRIIDDEKREKKQKKNTTTTKTCPLYTYHAADEEDSVYT